MLHTTMVWGICCVSVTVLKLVPILNCKILLILNNMILIENEDSWGTGTVLVADPLVMG